MLSSWLLQPQPTPLAATCPSLPSFSITQIQIADVLKELQNVGPDKSAGLDNLDPLFLKLSAAIVATPITILFNLSFVTSEIPKKMESCHGHPPLQRGGGTLQIQTVTDLYPSCPAFLNSSKAKLISYKSFIICVKVFTVFLHQYLYESHLY